MLISFRLALAILFICLIFLIDASSKNVVKHNISGTKRATTKMILSDLPRRSDVVVYVKALEKIIDYATNNKELIDLNFAFGLFLVQVNLKHVIIQGLPLPRLLIKKISTIIYKNEKLLKYFKYMAKKEDNDGGETHRLIYSMFTNDTEWISRLDKFDSPNLPDYPNVRYTSWEDYKKRSVMDDYVPQPADSDMCMASLAKNTITVTDNVPMCKVAPSCYDILVKGSDYGYALSHRMLLLVLARYARGCVIFSPRLDMELSRRFCTASYAEAEFIAKNGYEVADLMLEQITVCSFVDSSLLRRTWLNNLIMLQTPKGCFKEIEPYLSIVLKGYSKLNGANSEDVKGLMSSAEVCGEHITSTASGCFSSAVRFILETLV